jgi:hypothetical protein
MPAKCLLLVRSVAQCRRPAPQCVLLPRPAKQLMQRARGVSPAVAAEPAAVVDPIAAASAGASEEAAAQQVAPAAPAASAPAAPPAEPAPVMAAADLADTARKAADGGMGSKSAVQVLAEQAAPDAKVVEAAKRLGIEDYLQPDHVTTNQTYRELAQAVKSIPGSEGRAAELEGLQKIGQRANDLIDELGGTHDVSTLSTDVKARLQATHDEIKSQADKLYDEVRANVPAKSDAPADNVLSMINARADELGGAKNLSSMEKMILSKLSPKSIKSIEVTPGNPLMPGAQTATSRTVQTLKQPTYALLDDVRRDLTAARIQRAGPFKDSDARLITMLEGALRNDQQAAAERFGQGATWDLAQKTSATYKSIQDDLSSLFGKDLDKSLVRTLSGSVKLLPQGDPSNFVRLVKQSRRACGRRSSPPVSTLHSVRAQPTARAASPITRHGTKGCCKNKQSYTAVMSNLPPEARKQLSDLYRVARSINASTRERITTGRINAIKDELKPADNLAARLYGVAKQSALGATVGSAVGAVAGPGVGAAVASALAKGAKPEAIRAVDKLITSSQFIELAKKAAAGTAPEQRRATLRLVHSATWKRFAHAAKQPINPTAAERWVTQALQNNNQQR